MASTSRQVGSALRVAVLGALVTARLGPLDAIDTAAADFAAAARPAWLVVIGCGLAVLALGVVSTTPWARASAQRTAEQLAGPVPEPVVAR